jgi:hypothetical protein
LFDTTLCSFVPLIVFILAMTFSCLFLLVPTIRWIRSFPSRVEKFLGVVSFWWGEATDEPAREDARPTENSNCTIPIFGFPRPYKFDSQMSRSLARPGRAVVPRSPNIRATQQLSPCHVLVSWRLKKFAYFAVQLGVLAVQSALIFAFFESFLRQKISCIHVREPFPGRAALPRSQTLRRRK